MKLFRTLGFGVVALLATSVLAGCDGAPSSVSTRQVLKTALQARQIARLFDEGTRASQNNDVEKLIAMSAQLRQIGATDEAKLLVVNAAEQQVSEAVQLDVAARQSSTRKVEIEAQAAQKYRLALRLDPQFSSGDWMLLNALGYHLADKGVSRADFQGAETLTRRALLRLDEIAKSLSVKPAEMKMTRAITRDSLAWALFKQRQFDQRKFDESRREQRQAVSEAQAALSQGASDPNGEALKELQSHLAQIEQAATKSSAAPTPMPSIEMRDTTAA